MSIATLILGQSGTGKSTSLRNLNPADCLLIKAIKKPLPFPSDAWKPANKANPNGSVCVTDKAPSICQLIMNSTKSIIIVDDFQYVMANEFMRRSAERGFDKFTEIGKNAWDIFNTASQAADHKRVYLLSHTEESESGKTKIKTIGKMLDEKVTLEGMVTICLQTAIINDQHIFMTKNNGHNTVKSPMGLFESEHIENDLAMVDAAICTYYSLTNTTNAA